MALPTNGRVIIETTVGEIDIELWSKETPKTCRNFLALAMEGYYDGVIFHRVVPGFLVQTGDKTGTGAGGESFYGEPFEDEIHPRLRFAHRGIVAMANSGTKNSNDSQFIITLDRADELHGKHTLFGRCMGDTIYNVLKIGEMELDPNGRPVYPPKIKSVRIIDNPFPDIIPRITAAEKRAQLRAKEKAQKAREEEAARRSAKKNVQLLSFDDDTEDVSEFRKKKAIARPDLVEAALPSTIPPMPPVPPSIDSKKGKDVAPPPPTDDEPEPTSKKKSKSKTDQKAESDITQIRQRHAAEQVAGSDARKAEIEKMEAEIRNLARRRAGSGSDSDSGHAKKKAKGKSYLGEELAKYEGLRGKKGKKGKRKDEGDILAAMDRFRGKLQGGGGGVARGDEDEGGEDKMDEGTGLGEDPGVEVDADRDFLTHSLQFPKDDGAETQKAERDYEVIDPRERGARAKEEERERRRAMKVKGGRRR